MRSFLINDFSLARAEPRQVNFETLTNPLMKVTHIAGVKRTVGEGMRVERHCANALAVARYLEGVPCVKRVLYPGLESSPYHELVKTQMNGLGTGILSFELADDVNGVGPRPEAPH